MRRFQMLINGERVDAADGQTFASLDPFRGEDWAEIPRGSKADADRAVAAARTAFEDGPWRRMHPGERGALMRRLAALIAENAGELAEIEVNDNGKLVAGMGGQLRYIPKWYDYFSGLADKIQGAVIPIDKPDMMN
ncbi:MAG: aldehyde dehydrogenase family protein, partial [Geminicoccaceae bacterium]|nr:aldehyde dehydrogenase family protein [Geminicoccaceae bacterium]